MLNAYQQNGGASSVHGHLVGILLHWELVNANQEQSGTD
ncbi:DNA polymerase [Salmonella phage 19]|nr:DNA polymerase [Salmonella phage 19]